MVKAPMPREGGKKEKKEKKKRKKGTTGRQAHLPGNTRFFITSAEVEEDESTAIFVF
jgi:hypothetical protein